MSYNYPLCNIHPEASIAKDVQIDAFVTIQADVVIGAGTTIGANAVIGSGTRIGTNCRIFPGAAIGLIPQDMKFAGEYTTAEIGNNVTIREFVTINRGTGASNKTIVEDNVLLLAYVHVAHDCIVRKGTIISNATNLAGHITVGERVVIGGMCPVHQFVRIGAHAMVAGGVGIRKDIPPYILAGHDPPTYVGVNHRGLRRRGFAETQIQQIQEIYRVLFLSRINNSRAIVEIEQSFEATPEREEILNFVKTTERGLIKGYSFRQAE